MPIALTLKKVSPAVNPDKNLVAATVAGNYVNGVGDVLPLNAIQDPSGIGQVPMDRPPTITPFPTQQNLGGYYCQVQKGTTLANYMVRFFQPGGAELASGAYPGAITGGELGFEITA